MGSCCSMWSRCRMLVVRTKVLLMQKRNTFGIYFRSRGQRIDNRLDVEKNGRIKDDC